MLHVIWKYFNAYNFESGPILQHSSHIVHQWWNLHISNSVSHAVRVTDTKKPPRSYRRTSSLIIHFQRKHTQDFAGFCILALIIYSSFPPPQKKKKLKSPWAHRCPSFHCTVVTRIWVLGVPWQNLSDAASEIGMQSYVHTCLSCILSREFIL